MSARRKQNYACKKRKYQDDPEKKRQKIKKNVST